MSSTYQVMDISEMASCDPLLESLLTLTLWETRVQTSYELDLTVH